MYTNNTMTKEQALATASVMELIEALEKALPQGEMVVVGNGDALTDGHKEWLMALAGGCCGNCGCGCCEDEDDDDCYDDRYEEGYQDGLKRAEEEYAEGYEDGKATVAAKLVPYMNTIRKILEDAEIEID